MLGWGNHLTWLRKIYYKLIIVKCRSKELRVIKKELTSATYYWIQNCSQAIQYCSDPSCSLSHDLDKPREVIIGDWQRVHHSELLRRLDLQGTPREPDWRGWVQIAQSIGSRCQRSARTPEMPVGAESYWYSSEVAAAFRHSRCFDSRDAFERGWFGSKMERWSSRLGA